MADKATVFLLALTQAQMAKVREYANYSGVSGGWQNLCRRIEPNSVEVSSPPTEAELFRLGSLIDAVEKKQRGLFGPIDPDS